MVLGSLGGWVQGAAGCVFCVCGAPHLYPVHQAAGCFLPDRLQKPREGSQRPRRFSAKRTLRTQGLALRSLGKFPYSGHPPFYLEKRGPRVSRCAGRGDTHSRTGAEGEWGRGASRAPEAPPEPQGRFHSQEKHSKWEDRPETASEGLESGGVSDL